MQKTSTQTFAELLELSKMPFKNGYFGKENSAAFKEAMAYNQRIKDAKAKLPGILTTDYQAAYDEAKAANEARYNEILAGYDKLMGDSASKYDAIIANQAGMGNAEKADLMHNYDVLGSRQQQGLVNSGLSSTTIRPAVMGQNQTAMQRALSLVNGRLQGQNTALQVGSLNNAQGLTQNKFGVMERRTDDYPDQNTYLELLKQYGNA